MFERLEILDKRYQEIEKLLVDPVVIADKARYLACVKERSGIAKLVSSYREYQKILGQIDDVKNLLEDKHQGKELLCLAEEEYESLQQKELELRHTLEGLLLGEDAEAERNVIVELRAGTGGEEATLFVSDLYRMYSRYAAGSGWKIEVMNTNPTGIGGLKEVIFSVSGEDAYKKLKYESGVHRVQRVPATEASGRIHTSAATVAVLQEAEEVEVRFQPDELRIDAYRSSGKGGQGVNTTDSAVRITHIPTGIVVTCQDERSQMKNKTKAMRVLRARLFDKMKQEQQSKVSLERRQQIGTGDRSEKIRTYNFPERRVTDHRIGLTLYKLNDIMEGELDELFSALVAADKENVLNVKCPGAGEL
jgi:peptide chain release factor 1